MKFPRFASFLFAALLILLAEKDACAQWKNVAPGLVSTTFYIYGSTMCFKDGICWVANDNLYMSTDSGTSWTIRYRNLIKLTNGSFDVNFADPLHGIISGSNGTFLTRDGGYTWSHMGSTASSNSSCFGNTNLILASTFTAGSIDVSIDGGNTWTSTQIKNTPLCIRSFKNGTIQYNDAGESGIGIGHLNTSTDFGATWQRSLQSFDQDSYTFSDDSCDYKRIYMVHEDLLSPTDQFAKIYLSTDGGDSWQIQFEKLRPFFSGSIAVSRNAIYCPTISNGIYRSTDRGVTWGAAGGPNSSADTRLITVINDNIILALDDQGNVWRTLNSGGDPLPNPFAISQSSLFFKDTIRDCNTLSPNFVKISTFGCNPPSVVSLNIVGKDSLSYSIIPLTADSLGVNFNPQDSGQLNADLVLTLSDGTHYTITLGGYEMGLHPLSLATTEQVTDTIGGSINVPITINGLDHAEDVNLVLHYDRELRYHGSYSLANVQFDMLNESWSGRSKLHIAQAKPNTILGYARFDVFNDSLTKSHVTFDSVTVLTAVAPCQYILPASVTSTITPPSGCGIQTISRFMHDSAMPQLSIIPNPTSGEISITSTQNLGDCSIAVYDMLGIKQSINSAILQKNNPAKIILPVGNGVYNIRVQSAERTFDLRVVVNK